MRLYLLNGSLDKKGLIILGPDNLSTLILETLKSGILIGTVFGGWGGFIRISLRAPGPRAAGHVSLVLRGHGASSRLKIKIKMHMYGTTIMITMPQHIAPDSHFYV